MELSTGGEQKPWRGGRIVLALVVILVLGWGLARWGDAEEAEWPPIRDRAAVRRAATDLCRDAGGWRELPLAEYPAALVVLRPASISVSRERVYVALVPVPGGRTRFHGYYIWPDATDRSNGGIEREESDQRTER